MNTFWYNFWYSDNNYASQVKQDKIFIKLINIYLIYGISVPHNVFANLYWYAKHFKKLDFPSYFRWFTTKDTGRGKVETYAIRKSIFFIFYDMTSFIKIGINKRINFHETDRKCSWETCFFKIKLYFKHAIILRNSQRSIKIDFCLKNGKFDWNSSSLDGDNMLHKL